jgi:uncharacterized protein
VATASREFQIFAKPIGAICNLDCSYCYYLKKEHLYPKGDKFRMTDDVLEAYIVQHIEASPSPVINFSWHGGEPTLLGLDYFRKIVSLQRKHHPSGRRVSNGMQTNGTFLNDEWCSFLAEEGFSVGLSMDGPRELHDRYRVTKGQKPTHRQVMHAFKLLRRYKIPCDLLCVIHDQNVHYPIQVYRFFKEIGAEYLGFLPFVEPTRDGSGGVSSHTVPADVYGSFLCSIFDEWVRQDIGRVMVQIFEEAARPACGLEHSLCIFRETCGDVPVVEHNGDFYSCDHFVEPKHHLGNIRETPLVEFIESPAQRKFGLAKRDQLPRYCRECEVLAMCNGGCPKDRFVRTPDGEDGLNYLCAGLKRFFLHSRPYLLKLASLQRAGQPPERLMELVRAEDAKRLPQAGRNDPCPCGSGRKYKKCCLFRQAGTARPTF